MKITDAVVSFLEAIESDGLKSKTIAWYRWLLLSEFAGHCGERLLPTITAADLRAHTSTWETPIAIDYRGVRVTTHPPNSSGIVALELLGILAQFEAPPPDAFGPRGVTDPRWIHLGLEAAKLAMADRDGTVFDGDQLLYAMVKHRHAEGRLRGGVVGTLMTNFALERRFAEMGIAFQRAKVGDRYVLETLLERGWECGGENSGHLMCLDCHSTGDAIISALQVLAAVVGCGKSLKEYTRELTLLPQVLVNVRLKGKTDLQSPPIREAMAKAEAELAGKGRVLLRPSGTEPVVRVMVEGEDRANVQALADAIAAVVKATAEPAAA